MRFSISSPHSVLNEELVFISSQTFNYCLTIIFDESFKKRLCRVIYVDQIFL